MTMIGKFKSKLTKPATPKTVDEMLAAGGRIVWHVPVTDEKGRTLSAEEVKELHLRTARMQIDDHARIVEKATGLRSLEEIEPERMAAQEKTGAARKHWELMQRRYFGGMAEMPEVEQAQHTFNVAAEAGRAIGQEYSLVKAANDARAEIERLRKEYKL